MATVTQFGYIHIDELKNHPCPCNDPGNYACMLTIDGGIDILECWCGRRTAVTFDDEAERQEFIDKYRKRKNGNEADRPSTG
jgi:hypothetical protein